MDMRLLLVTAEVGHEDTLTALCEQASNIKFEVLASQEGRTTISILAGADERQAVIDGIQKSLGGSENWQMVVLPVEAVIPFVEDKHDEGEKKDKKSKANFSREELYHDLEQGTRIDGNYILLVILSTITVAIGLIKDNIAVVIGAMVIAPLLGPNLALTLGATLGHSKLILSALRASAVGLSITLALSFLIGVFIPFERTAKELLDRTEVGLDSAALAMASGAAAVLSLITGLSSTLVGVMVAVALLPPAATMAIMASDGNWDKSLGAALLLTVNIVCVNLAGQIVYLARGISPRTESERNKARKTATLSIGLWTCLLITLVYFVQQR